MPVDGTCICITESGFDGSRPHLVSSKRHREPTGDFVSMGDKWFWLSS